MGLFNPTILGGNSYLSRFYDRGAIKDPAHTGTSRGLSQAIDRGPIRKFLPKYANVYVTIQSHGLSAGAWTHYVTANGVRDGLRLLLLDPSSTAASSRPCRPSGRREAVYKHSPRPSRLASHVISLFGQGTC